MISPGRDPDIEVGPEFNVSSAAVDAVKYYGAAGGMFIGADQSITPNLEHEDAQLHGLLTDIKNNNRYIADDDTAFFTGSDKGYQLLETQFALENLHVPTLLPCHRLAVYSEFKKFYERNEVKYLKERAHNKLGINFLFGLRDCLGIKSSRITNEERIALIGGLTVFQAHYRQAITDAYALRTNYRADRSPGWTPVVQFLGRIKAI